jgi:hypothetical protein
MEIGIWTEEGRRRWRQQSRRSGGREGGPRRVAGRRMMLPLEEVTSSRGDVEWKCRGEGAAFMNSQKSKLPFPPQCQDRGWKHLELQGRSSSSTDPNSWS